MALVFRWQNEKSALTGADDAKNWAALPNPKDNKVRILNRAGYRILCEVRRFVILRHTLLEQIVMAPFLLVSFMQLSQLDTKQIVMALFLLLSCMQLSKLDKIFGRVE